jgi:hypothetical protein
MIPATLSKHLDLLVVQNGRHCAGGEFGPRRLRDSFHHHLTGVEPPIVEGNTIHDNKFGGIGYLGCASAIVRAALPWGWLGL